MKKPADSSGGRLPRRGFLMAAWGAATAILLGEGGAALLRFLWPASRTGGFGGLVRAGRVDEFAVSSVSHVRAGRFYLSRLPEGFLALWHRCTHLGCTVPWAPAEGQFHCPCHSSLFDVRGEVTGGPAPRPMDLFPITIVDGEIWADTSQAIQRDEYDESQVARV